MLQLFVVDPDGTSADLHSVDYKVVGIGPYLSGIGVEQQNIFRFGRSERMVFGIIPFGFFVPFEQGEIGNP